MKRCTAPTCAAVLLVSLLGCGITGQLRSHELCLVHGVPLVRSEEPMPGLGLVETGRWYLVQKNAPNWFGDVYCDVCVIAYEAIQQGHKIGYAQGYEAGYRDRDGADL